MKKEEILVVLPARGGSKRIPNKNIRKIGNKPMISWPLKKLFRNFKKERIIVSTDDLKIKKICEKTGLKIRFLRPKNLSGDKVGTIEVVNHALKWFEKNFYKISYVLIVYPTAIFLNINDIKLAMKKIKQEKNCECVFPACTYSYPVQRSFYLTSNKNIKMFEPNHFKSRSQDLVEAFHDAGQFYLCKSELIRKKKNLFKSKSKIIKIPRYRSMDIDTVEDFEYAKKMIKNV